MLCMQGFYRSANAGQHALSVLQHVISQLLPVPQAQHHSLLQRLALPPQLLVNAQAALATLLMAQASQSPQPGPLLTVLVTASSIMSTLERTMLHTNGVGDCAP